MSSWYYLLFINDLLNQLETSGDDVQVGDIHCGNPTLADDLTILCPSKITLERQLNIAQTYANKWGYSFNKDKCKVVVFTRSTPTRINVNFDNTTIQSSDTSTHVGIVLHESLKPSAAIESRVTKARASFFSTMALEDNPGDVNPTILSSIARKVTFPTALYGAELWYEMTMSNVLKLEKLVRLFAKHLQHLPFFTRTDMALSMLGWHSMQTEVDKRKLIFLQKLCVMDTDLLTKWVFSHRLNLFAVKGHRNQMGFIPEIWRILTKCNLKDHLKAYLETGEFPKKCTWKKIIETSVNSAHQNAWTERTQNDSDFDRFLLVHD